MRKSTVRDATLFLAPEHLKGIATNATREPSELHQLFIAAANNHDVDALIALYEPQATTTDLEGRTLKNLDELRGFLGGFLSGLKRLEGGTRRALVAGDIALLSSSFTATLSTPDGGEVTATGTSAEVARRQPDGTWLFLIDDPSFLR